MDDNSIKQLKQQIDDLTVNTSEAVIIAKEAVKDSVKTSQRLEDMLVAYIKEDTAWKGRAEPMLKAYENGNWLWGVIVKLLKFFGLLGTAVGAYLLIKDALHK